MYIIKNALISIWRNKGRNILITIIVMVIAASCAVTLAIRNSSLKIVDAYLEKYEVETTIGMDRTKLIENIRKEENTSQKEMIEKFNDLESITVDEIKKYGDSEYVKKYYYYYETSMNGKDIEEATDSLVKEVTTTETTQTTQTFGPFPNGDRPRPNGGNYGSKKTTKKVTTQIEKIFNEKAQKGVFSVVGYSSLESMTDFIEGKYTVTNGTIFTNFNDSEKDYECIISEELAQINNLSVDDTITLKSPNDEKITFDLKITGIYKESSETSNNMTDMFTSSANKIIVPEIVIEKMINDDKDLSIVVTPTFILNSKEVVDLFKEEVKEKGLDEYYTVTDNLDIVENATKSINNVKNFATTFLIITLIIGSIVLLVINMINIRERKYEIGVLRTIGMKKITVISQFVIELLVVSICGLMLGAGIGAFSSVNIANNLLQTEINNATKDMESIHNNFGGNNPGERPDNNFNKDKIDFGSINGMVNIEQVDDINAIVDIVVLAQLLGIGILLTIVSSISASVAIARFSPLTILKERS